MESDHVSDNDDLFEDLSESEENGELRVQVSRGADEDAGVGADDMASRSPSIALSPAVGEYDDWELRYSQANGDNETETRDTSRLGDLQDVRGSCEELEAQIDAMIADGSESMPDESDMRMVEPAIDALNLDTAIEAISAISDQVGSDDADADAGVCDRDAESEVLRYESTDGESVAAETNDVAETMELQEKANSPDDQQQDSVAPGDGSNGLYNPGNFAVGEKETGDSNVDNKLDSSPTCLIADVDEEPKLRASPINHDEEPTARFSPVFETAHESFVDEEVLSASPTHQHRSAPSVGLVADYSVATVFPVVYDSIETACIPTAPNTRGDDKTSKRRLSPIDSATVSTANSTPTTDMTKRTNRHHIARLQRQLEAAEQELRNIKRSFSMQLSVLEADKKTLSSRNARLHSQLESTTTDLQRVSSELARVRTENELYAAKLPQLQAELRHEATQVDESRSQSLQAQLSIGQLRARAQVVQKRNEELEAANAKSSAKLRENAHEIRRKAEAIETQAAKIAQLEMNIRDQAIKHGDEIAAWRHRLSNASQRSKQDMSKAASEWKLSGEQQSRETKRQADIAIKKRRELEACIMRLEEAAEQRKRDSCALRELVASGKKESIAMKTVLKKASQTEAMLRSEIASLRCRLRDAERGQRAAKERFRRRTTLNLTRSRRGNTQQAHPHVVHACGNDSDDGLINDNSVDCRLVDTLPAASATTEAATMTVESTSPCGQCAQLIQQLRDSRQELTRVRVLHAQELRVQTQAMEAVLKRTPVQSA